MGDQGDRDELWAAIRLSRLPGVGSKSFKALVDVHGTPSRALAAYLDRPQCQSSTTKSPLDHTMRDRLERLPTSVQFTTLGAADYPRLLAHISEPPPYLFRKGPLWPLSSPLIAIVGPRECSDRGRIFAETLASKLAFEGVTIVSGGAQGLDAAAHAGALAVGGSTALVTATGIDRCYPLENEPLHRRIERVGCVLTELLPGTPPRRTFFPTRNRILVGLCDATIIVEGGLESGTATSASHALKLGRPLLTWARSAEPALRALPEHLIERGAIALAEPRAQPVLKVLRSDPWRDR